MSPTVFFVILCAMAQIAGIRFAVYLADTLDRSI